MKDKVDFYTNFDYDMQKFCVMDNGEIVWEGTAKEYGALLDKLRALGDTVLYEQTDELVEVPYSSGRFRTQKLVQRWPKEDNDE